jgi:ADP-ribosylglycohydrolase
LLGQVAGDALGSLVEFEPADAIRRAWPDGVRDLVDGGTTSAGLDGDHNHASEANGSLMRVSPLGVWAHALPPRQAVELARQESRLTHPSPVCADACAAFVVAIGAALRTGDRRASYDAALRWARDGDAEDTVRAALQTAAEVPPWEYERNQGWVLIALQNAFYQLRNGPEDPVRPLSWW